MSTTNNTYTRAVDVLDVITESSIHLFINLQLSFFTIPPLLGSRPVLHHRHHIRIPPLSLLFHRLRCFTLRTLARPKWSHASLKIVLFASHGFFPVVPLTCARTLYKLCL